MCIHIGSIAHGSTVGINGLCFDFDKPCPAVLLYFYRKFIVGFRCNSNSPFVFGFGRLPHHADDGVVDCGVQRVGVRVCQGDQHRCLQILEVPVNGRLDLKLSRAFQSIPDFPLVFVSPDWVAVLHGRSELFFGLSTCLSPFSAV